MHEILVGKAKKITAVVTEQMSAKAVESGDLEVLATPVMIALMEKCANESLMEFLTNEETSVGVNIAVKHVKPSKVGETITVSTEIEEVKGTKIRFSAKAKDETGEIGYGEHTRVVVDRKKFLDKM